MDSMLPHRLEFNPGLGKVRFMVDILAMGQIFFQVLQFSPVSIIPPMLHTHRHLHVAFTRMTDGQSLGMF